MTPTTPTEDPKGPDEVTPEVAMRRFTALKSKYNAAMERVIEPARSGLGVIQDYGAHNTARRLSEALAEFDQAKKEMEDYVLQNGYKLIQHMLMKLMKEEEKNDTEQTD